MMMISVDRIKCKKCGVCIKMMQGYCISSDSGYPVFDERVCNTCQKCVSICPSQAIMVNNTYPEIIDIKKNYDPDLFFYLLSKRRSVKHYTQEKIPREIIEKIVSVAKFSPNQNKNIAIKVVDDPRLIKEIDTYAIKFVKRMYAFLFGFKPFEVFIRIFYKDMDAMKKKMEHHSFKRVINENTQVVIIAYGNKKMPVTQSSAHYMLATMMMMAEVLGVGNCLMDSINLTLKTSKKLREKLNIDQNVLGALVLGYSNENIRNIPHGYEVSTSWNN